MRKFIKILSILFAVIVSLSGCNGETEYSESTVSEISSVTGEQSETEVHKAEKNSKNTISATESKTESPQASTEKRLPQGSRSFREDYSVTPSSAVPLTYSVYPLLMTLAALPLNSVI